VLIGRALAKEPAARPSSADEMARVLERSAGAVDDSGAELTQLLTRLFAKEKAEAERAVAELRASCAGGGARVPAEATRTVDSMATTIRPIVRPGWSRGFLWAALALGVVAAVAGFAVLRPGASASRPARGPEPPGEQATALGRETMPAAAPPVLSAPASAPEASRASAGGPEPGATSSAPSPPPQKVGRPPVKPAPSRKASPPRAVEPGLVKEYPF
jgi:hypothetical protein